MTLYSQLPFGHRNELVVLGVNPKQDIPGRLFVNVLLDTILGTEGKTPRETDKSSNKIFT